MPADQAGQGEQAANANASTPSTPEATKDKPTTTEQSEQGRVNKDAVNISALDARLEIPSEILAQLPKLEPEDQAVDTPLSGASTTQEGVQHESPTETTPEAKETKPKTEDEDEDEDDPPAAEGQDDLEGKSIDELKKIAAKRQKRINRQTRKNWRLEEQLDKVESEAKELRDQIGKDQARSPDRPSGKIPELQAGWFPDEETARTHSTLTAERDKADAIIAWCNEHYDGATSVEGDKETFISPQQVAQFKSRAEGDRLRVAPEIAVIEREAKQAYRVQKSQTDDVSKKIWPELFDKSTQAYQFAQSTFRKYPSIKESPEANWLLGVHLEGLAALKARSQKANGNGSDKPRRDISPRAFEPRVPIAPHTPEPPSREVTPSSTKRYNEAMSNLKNDPDGSAASLAAVFAAEDEMSRTRAGSKTPVRS